MKSGHADFAAPYSSLWECETVPVGKILLLQPRLKHCTAFCVGEHCPNLSQIVTIECKFTTELIIAAQPWESWDPNTISQNQMFLHYCSLYFISLLLIVFHFLESLHYVTALPKDIAFIQATKIKTSYFYQLLATFTALWNSNLYNNTDSCDNFLFLFFKL